MNPDEFAIYGAVSDEERDWLYVAGFQPGDDIEAALADFRKRRQRERDSAKDERGISEFSIRDIVHAIFGCGEAHYRDRIAANKTRDFGKEARLHKSADNCLDRMYALEDEIVRRIGMAPAVDSPSAGWVRTSENEVIVNREDVIRIIAAWGPASSLARGSDMTIYDRLTSAVEQLATRAEGNDGG